jgi:DNA-directed RNA polymerase specialized sigma24 family protein
MEADADQAILDELFKLLEPDLQSTEKRYRQCRFKLIKFFAWKYCEDPDNLADETISRLVKKVRDGQRISADNPYSYVYGIATNVFREYLRAKKKNTRLADIDEARETAVQPVTDDCKKLCFKQLPREKRELLARYYAGDDRGEIAREQELTLNALRLQVHRIKQWLRRCREDCQKHSAGVRN